MSVLFASYGPIFRMDHIVTNALAILGMFTLVFGGFFYMTYYKRSLNKILFTVRDGTKLFEKMKYDLKLDGEIKVDKRRLYSNPALAESIFRGAMEYNRRYLVAYFNEKVAKIVITKRIGVFFKRTFLLWILFFIIVIGGTYTDFVYWLLNVKSIVKDSLSGVVSIFVLFFIMIAILVIMRLCEYFSIKKTIEEEVTKIDVAKKEKVWVNYLWVFYGTIIVQSVALLLIFINMIF